MYPAEDMKVRSSDPSEETDFKSGVLDKPWPRF